MKYLYIKLNIHLFSSVYLLKPCLHVCYSFLHFIYFLLQFFIFCLLFLYICSHTCIYKCTCMHQKDSSNRKRNMRLVSKHKNMQYIHWTDCISANVFVKVQTSQNSEWTYMYGQCTKHNIIYMLYYFKKANKYKQTTMQLILYEMVDNSRMLHKKF